MLRILSALFRSLAAQFPQHLRSVTSRLSALFPQYLSTVAAVLFFLEQVVATIDPCSSLNPTLLHSYSVVFPHCFRSILAALQACRLSASFCSFSVLTVFPHRSEYEYLCTATAVFCITDFRRDYYKRRKLAGRSAEKDV